VLFRGRCALVALPSCSGHLGFYVGNEGLPVGCTPNGPAKYFWVLGCFLISDLLEVGMPRVALPDPLQPCRISGCLYNSIRSKINTTSLRFTVSTTTEDFFMRRTFQDLAGYPRILDHQLEASSRSAHLQSLPKVGPARLLAAMLGDLGVSTLRSIKTMT
jgi:hypothetical protein